MPWNGRVTIAMFKSHISSTPLFTRAVHGGRYTFKTHNMRTILFFYIIISSISYLHSSNIASLEYDSVRFVMSHPTANDGSFYNKSGNIIEENILLSHIVPINDHETIDRIFNNLNSENNDSIDSIFSMYTLLFYKNKKLVCIITPNLLSSSSGFISQNKKLNINIRKHFNKNSMSKIIRFFHNQISYHHLHNKVKKSLPSALPLKSPFLKHLIPYVVKFP